MKEGTFGPQKEKFKFNAFLLFVQGLFNLFVAFLGTFALSMVLQSERFN